ncbi:MAG: hypothetical protein CVU88_00020 [Firmicutes bacterium HGW-Firmicutes-13]|nr:MAG: hypothetical protein CVU88_00020 [Firmicutes bacterium HGW-Firmicutes-13]
MHKKIKEKEGIKTISIFEEKNISKILGISVKEVQIQALKESIIPGRYLRNVGAYGIEGQIKLLQSTAAVVGAGGLGGWLIEILARAGVGKLIVIDRDSFEDSNLNRQILCTENNICQPKVTAARKRIEEINSAVQVEEHHLEVTSQNINDLIKDADVVVDALDNIDIRFTVHEAAEKLNIPFVHGAIGGFNAQVTTIFPGDKSLEKIYGPWDSHVVGGVEKIFGNPSPSPGMCASWQANEAIKLLIGKGSLLRNKLLFLDAASLTIEIIQL